MGGVGVKRFKGKDAPPDAFSETYRIGGGALNRMRLTLGFGNDNDVSRYQFGCGLCSCCAKVGYPAKADHNAFDLGGGKVTFKTDEKAVIRTTEGLCSHIFEGAHRDTAGKLTVQGVMRAEEWSMSSRQRCGVLYIWVATRTVSDPI